MRGITGGADTAGNGLGRKPRRRSSFSRGDAASLIAGVALLVGMVSWFSWRVVENISKDRAVAAGKPATPEQGH